MSYVIYDKESTKTLLAPARSVGCYVENYKSESAAKAALTRLTKKGMLGGNSVKDDFAIANTYDFRIFIEKTVTRKNAMTGEEFQEPVNTPYATSPASENYWSS